MKCALIRMRNIAGTGGLILGTAGLLFGGYLFLQALPDIKRLIKIRSM